MRKVILSAFSLLAVIAGVNAQSIMSEDFESGMPSGWTQTTLSTDGGWNHGNATSLSSQAFPIPEHTNMLATNDDACNCDKSADILMTPSIDLSSYSGESIRLRFDLFFLGATYQGATESLELMVSVNGGSFSNISTIAGNNDWVEATIVDVSAYAGESDVVFAFNFNDGAGWTYGAALDNFNVEVPNAHDIKLTSAVVPGYSATDIPQIITGVVTNLGGSAESAIDVSWTDGTNTYTTTLSGTLNSGESMSFEHPDGIALAAGVSASIDVTANVSNDADASNNTLTGFDVVGVPFWPTKAVVGEEATGTWCGWCPRGMVGMEYMEEEHGEDWIGIAVHNNDPMADADYDSWLGTLISGYPSGMVDRNGVIDPAAAELEAAFEEAIQNFGYASIGLLPLIDEDDEVSIRISLDFAVEMDEDMSLAVMIVEDGLTGSTSDWNQTNYYSYQSQNIALTGAGFDWQAESGSVMGVTYNDVAREALLDPEGDDGIVPSTIEAGESVKHNMDAFTWDSDYEKENSTIVVMLLNNDGVVINAAESNLKEYEQIENNGVTYYIIDGDTFEVTEDGDIVPVGIADNAVDYNINVYPNPATGIVRISSQAIDAQTDISIYDMTGKLVISNSQLGIQSRRFSQTAEINVSSLQSGLYNIVLTNEDSSIKQTLSVIH